MLQFLLFAADDDGPRTRGWEAYRGSYPSRETARTVARSLGKEWWQIVDTLSQEIIEHWHC